VCALREHAIQKTVVVEAAGHGCGKITSPRAALRNEKEAEIDP